MKNYESPFNYMTYQDNLWKKWIEQHPIPEIKNKQLLDKWRLDWLKHITPLVNKFKENARDKCNHNFITFTNRQNIKVNYCTICTNEFKI